MPSSREYLNYVLAQLSRAGGVTHRPMMGEFILYCDGKVVGGVYDNRLLLKPTKTALQILEADGTSPNMDIPYDGAKPMIAADIDDAERTCSLIRAIAGDLPTPKKK